MSFIHSYQEILALIDAVDVLAYAKTRNQLDGAVSRLSPYITRGVITLPLIRARILERYTPVEAEKFLQELAWREYFQRVWWNKGDQIFTDLRFPRTDWRHEALVAGIVDAETGINVIDDAVRLLYETGYMHNHARMWVAALACNLAKAHWLPMSRWLYYHLLDGDLASNTLSWQWVAGTSVSKRYDCNQALINACSPTKQTGTFLDIPRETLHTIAVPAALEATVADTLATVLPVGDTISSVAGQSVLLYHPWHLNPTWRESAEVRQILVLEPSHFARYPVSGAVLEFIIRLGKTVIPKLELFVGEVDTLPGIATVTSCYTMAHPTNLHWPVVHDAPTWLYPTVTVYYPSFFTYWQACQQTH